MDNNNNFSCSSKTRGGSATGQMPIAAPASPALAAKVCEQNPIRKQLYMQNTGIVVVYVGLGYQPTPTDYSFSLAPGSANDDGKGEKWTSSIWQGEIYILSPALSAGAKAIFTELT